MEGLLGQLYRAALTYADLRIISFEQKFIVSSRLRLSYLGVKPIIDSFTYTLFSIHSVYIYSLFWYFVQNMKEDSDTNSTQWKSLKTEFKQWKTVNLNIKSILVNNLRHTSALHAQINSQITGLNLTTRKIILNFFKFCMHTSR